MGTCFENWNCEEFKGYNYGYTDISDMDEFEFKPSNRTRKVTITEITDESNMDDNEIDFDLNAEELHKSFETVIEDWKIKMEVIIGDGLKKLRKANKEKKLMMKYLPGDKRVQQAKVGIAKEWKIDFQKAFGTTHAKLEKLAADKTKEVEGIAKTNIKEMEINKNKKKVVNIEFNSIADKNESPYGNLKDLIKELDRMCNILQGESPTIHSIPIYSKEARGQLLPAYNNDWLDLQRTMLYNHKDVNIYLNNRQNFLDVLEDFKIKFYNTKDKLKKTSGSRIENTNAVRAQSRMLERKFKKEEFMLKQFKKNGKDRYLVIKKKPSENNATLETEDIFKDWKFNFEDVFEQRKQAAIKARKTRTRKLSNRAMRKELIKEINEDEKNKPMSYSDIVKKNIKAPMEDIFEAWRDYLQELDDIINDDSRTSFCKGDSMEDILATANCFQKELQDCGQPTVRSTTSLTKPNKLRNVGAWHYEKEIYFAIWRHNLDMDQSNDQDAERVKYEAENHFSKWMHNLREPLTPSVIDEESELEVENIFEDWMFNFHANELSRSNSKMLKNKQRQQRRSKKKSKSPH